MLDDPVAARQLAFLERVVRATAEQADARDAETIFERYGRGDTALRHGIRGHGLGLFICRRIAESHSGTIDARPRSTGSYFTLVLPRRQPVP
ncbi:MAG: ATP-binding protein [Chloroflexota bacterium]